MFRFVRDRAWCAPIIAVFVASRFSGAIDTPGVMVGFTAAGVLAGWFWQWARPDDVSNRLAPWSLLVLVVTVGLGCSDDYRREFAEASASAVCILAIGVGVIAQARYGRNRTGTVGV